MSFSAPPRHILHMIVAGFEPPTVWSVTCGLDHSATGSGGRLKFSGRAKERKRYEETRTSYRESCGDQAYSPTGPRREDFFSFQKKGHLWGRRQNRKPDNTARKTNHKKGPTKGWQSRQPPTSLHPSLSPRKSLHHFSRKTFLRHFLFAPLDCRRVNENVK